MGAVVAISAMLLIAFLVREILSHRRLTKKEKKDD